MNTKERYPFFTGDAPKEEVEAIIAMAGSEEAGLRGSQLVRCGGGYGILVDKGSKGGKVRVAPLVGPPAQVAQVVQACRRAGPEKVFPQGIHSGADIHGLQACLYSPCPPPCCGGAGP